MNRTREEEEMEEEVFKNPTLPRPNTAQLLHIFRLFEVQPKNAGSTLSCLRRNASQQQQNN